MQRHTLKNLENSKSKSVSSIVTKNLIYEKYSL